MNIVKSKLFSLMGLALVFILSSGCTHNPFGGDDEIPAKRTVSGQVNLERSENSGGLYIWLEGIDTGTFTDADGNFQLTLPPPASQPGGGFTGSADLYFYIANFRMDTTKLILRNGEFLYSQGEIDEKGNFRQPITIDKLMSINTTLSPASIDTAFNGTIQATITIDVWDSQIELQTIRSNLQYFAIAAVEKQNADPPFVRSFITGAIKTDTTLGRGRHTFISDYFYQANFLPPGEYILMPYMWINQDNIPPGLIESLNAPYARYNENYVNLPFQRSGGNLEVKE